MWLWLEPQVSKNSTLSRESPRGALADTAARPSAAFRTLPAGSCSADCSCWSSGWGVSTWKPRSQRQVSSCGATEQTYLDQSQEHTHTCMCEGLGLGNQVVTGGNVLPDSIRRQNPAVPPKEHISVGSVANGLHCESGNMMAFPSVPKTN